MKGSLLLPRRIRRLLIAVSIATWVAAFITTHVPGDMLPPDMPKDTPLHFLGYMGLSSLVLITMAVHGMGRLRHAIVLICVIVIYAALDEITQAIVNRDPAFDDWLADTAGAATGIILAAVAFRAFVRWRRRRESI